MNIDKDLIFLDVETTGLDSKKDRIIELYMYKVRVDGVHEEFYSRFNPEVEMTKENIEIHGITDEELINAPKFKDKIDDILNFIKDSDLSGFNITNFDLLFIFEEFIRVGKVYFFQKHHRIIDSYKIWINEERRTLPYAYKRFTGEVMENHHSAKSDVLASKRVLEGQMTEFNIKSLEDVKFKQLDLGGYLKVYDGEIIIDFGKHKGKKLKDVLSTDVSYLKWILNSSDKFPSDFILLLKNFLNTIKKHV